MGISDKTILNSINDLGIEVSDLVGGYRTTDGKYFPQNYVLTGQRNEIKRVPGKGAGVWITKEFFTYTYDEPQVTPVAKVVLKHIVFTKINGLNKFKPKVYGADQWYFDIDGVTLYIKLINLIQFDYLKIIEDIKNGFNYQYDCINDKSITPNDMMFIFDKSDFKQFLLNIV